MTRPLESSLADVTAVATLPAASGSKTKSTVAASTAERVRAGSKTSVTMPTAPSGATMGIR